MSKDQTDPADTIARALLRLRGQRPQGWERRGGFGEQPPGGGPGETGSSGWAGGHGGPHHPRGHSRFGMPPQGAGFRGRGGAMAWMRMLEALVAAAEPLSVSALGEAIGVDQPRASRLVQQAFERGLVRREADPEDARRTRIALTESGRWMAKRMTEERRESLEQALSALSPDEQSELARLLSKLADNWQA
ncbi:MAG: MarR family winged helix-turn-helix transcriptional regulator [Leucobacter sp.]